MLLKTITMKRLRLCPVPPHCEFTAHLRERLPDYFRGRLPVEQRDEIDKHIINDPCPECDSVWQESFQRYMGGPSFTEVVGDALSESASEDEQEVPFEQVAAKSPDDERNRDTTAQSSEKGKIRDQKCA